MEISAAELAILRRFTDPVHKLPDEDMQSIASRMQKKSFAKGENFLLPGQVCLQMGFLLQGLARVYYLVEEKDFTSYFNTAERNPLISGFSSFLTGRPSGEGIHFLEDSTILLIGKSDLDELYESSFEMQKLGRLLAEFNYVLSMERIYSLQHKPALERYRDLLSQYPNLLNRVPHYHIASYLGITPESFSRIKREV